jgi:iron complex outermembrane recepter protein
MQEALQPGRLHLYSYWETLAMPKSKSSDLIRRDRLSAAALGAAALLGSAAVLAQNAGAPNPAPDQTAQNSSGAASSSQLQEVVVTAQFRSESAQQTPLAITAINASSLAERGQTSLTQVAADAPSLNLMADETAFGPTMAAYIRGIGQYDLDPALEPGVGIYIDDVYFGTLTGSLLDLLDLDRVEVLRGPQGTLAGMNSEGGAVKLFSKAPDATPTVSFDGLYGSRNHVELRALANFALIPDKVFVRVSGVGNHQDGYVNIYDFGCANPSFTATATNGVTGTYSVAPGFNTHSGSCLLGQEGGKGYTAGRLAVRWVINDSMDNTIIGDLTNQDQENPATTLLYAGPNPTNPAQSAAVESITIPTTSGALLPYDSTKVPAMIPKSMYASYASFCMPAITNPVTIPNFIPGVTGSNADQPAYCGQDRQLLKSWGVSDTFNWTLNDSMSLKNIISQRGYSSSWYEDNDASPWPVGLGGEWLQHHQFSEELRFNGKVGQIMDFTLGGFYFRELSVYGTHQDLWYATAPLVGFLNFLGEDPIEAHDKAGYLHTVWHLAPKLDFTAGVRYTSQDKDYTYMRTNPQGGTDGSAVLVGALNGVTGHYAANRWDYRADLDYRFTDQVMGYAQVSTGFKGGGVNPRPFYAVQAVHFNPETLTTYEAGVKSTWLDNRVRLNLDGYFSQYRDIQETLLNCAGVDGIPPLFGTPCALPSNAGTAHEKGVELETEARFGGLQIDGSLSWLDFNYVALNPATGLQLWMVSPFTSKWTGNAGVQYTIPMGSIGALTARIDGNTRSGFYTNASNAPTNRVGGYTIYNARLTYEPSQGNWQISAQALNLADKQYYVNVFDLTSVGGGSVTGTPGAPLEADLEIKYTIK